MVSIWLFAIFPGYVREYGLSDLPCGRRRSKSARGDQIILDIPGTMGMDICGRHLSGLGSTVQLWVLQSDAYIASYRSDRYVSV